MRYLGEYVLGLDQYYLVSDKVTFRGQRYSCIKFVPRWLKKTPPEDLEHWENLTDFAKLPSLLSGQKGIRFQSTGDAPDFAETRIVLQTIDASPANPYMVEFDQFILAPFTGPGQFDLVERDASDIDVFDEEGEPVSGGESQVTLATKAGFADGDTVGGWSRFAKVITADKIYSVIFVPGDAGDGVYSIRGQEL